MDTTNASIRLEFLLSAELLNLDVNQWQWETESRFPMPMGCRLFVSIRSLEGMKATKWGDEVARAYEVEIGLRAGIPVIIWHRETCDSEEFLATVDEVLHDSGTRPLLDRARMIRANAFADGTGPRHVGSQLTILWDDPERMVIPVVEGVPAA